MSVSQCEAINLCTVIQWKLKHLNVHVGLTGGQLYKAIEPQVGRKDVDIIIYGRNADDENPSTDVRSVRPEIISLLEADSYVFTFHNNWLSKATYQVGRPDPIEVDFFFMERIAMGHYS